jgi:ABC-type Fe3+-citrate transport system substrate-binding protein
MTHDPHFASAADQARHAEVQRQLQALIPTFESLNWNRDFHDPELVEVRRQMKEMSQELTRLYNVLPGDTD